MCPRATRARALRVNPCYKRPACLLAQQNKSELEFKVTMIGFELYENMQDKKLTEKEVSSMSLQLAFKYLLKNQDKFENSFEPTDHESGNDCSDFPPLPPPKPYFDRDAGPIKPFVQPITLARARSSSKSRERFLEILGTFPTAFPFCISCALFKTDASDSYLSKIMLEA